LGLNKLEKRVLAIVSIWIFFFAWHLASFFIQPPPLPPLRKTAWTGPLALLVDPTEALFGFFLISGIVYVIVYVIYIVVSRLYLSVARGWRETKAPLP
jgi:hypothetical protein